jgi:hypothetical protein
VRVLRLEHGAKIQNKPSLKQNSYAPVPVSATLCGLVGSLPTLTAILALSGDGLAVGVNVIAIVHVEFPATDAPQVPPVTAKSPAFAPVVLPSLTDNENPDRLVPSVTNNEWRF